MFSLKWFICLTIKFKILSHLWNTLIDFSVWNLRMKCLKNPYLTILNSKLIETFSLSRAVSNEIKLLKFMTLTQFYTRFTLITINILFSSDQSLGSFELFLQILISKMQIFQTQTKKTWNFCSQEEWPNSYACYSEMRKISVNIHLRQ